MQSVCAGSAPYLTEEKMRPQPTDEFLDTARVRGEQVAKIVEHLTSSIGCEKTTGARLLAAGKLYEVAQSFTLASMAYERALEEGDALDEVRIRTAIVLLKSGEPRRALVIANALADASPRFVFNDISGRGRSVFTVQGDALRANCDFEGAEAAYRKALDILPGDEHAAGHLAILLMDKPRVDEAMILLQSLVADDRYKELQATINLLDNAPLRLPAIQSIVRNSLFVINQDV